MKVYNAGDLKKLISESANEFKAKLGDGVESKDKEINGKAYSDAKERAKSYDNGLKDENNWARGTAKYEKPDDNRTTLDYEVDNASEGYKKRIHAQVKGYTSEAEMNNGIEKSGDFSNNEKIFQGIKKSGEQFHKNKKMAKSSGLTSKELPDSTFEHGQMYESKDGFNMRTMIDKFRSASQEALPTLKEEKYVDTYYFKKMEFLSEGHMISRIPDEGKVEGKQFKMTDKTKNTYLLEWKGNKAIILAHENKNGLNESISKFNHLSNYTSNDTKTTNSYRLNEGDANFAATLDKARKIIK